MSWRCVAGSALSSTQCGVLCKRIHAGSGTPWIITPGRGWRMCSDAAKTPSSSSYNSSWSPVAARRFTTDGWGAYERHIDAKKHHVGKENTQKIESKHINLRTRIKRLVRRTLCFSKTEQMHDLVIGLFINRYEFG